MIMRNEKLADAHHMDPLAGLQELGKLFISRNHKRMYLRIYIYTTKYYTAFQITLQLVYFPKSSGFSAFFLGIIWQKRRFEAVCIQRESASSWNFR